MIRRTAQALARLAPALSIEITALTSDNLHCPPDSSPVLPARYLDLHELHRVFTNGKFGRQIDYLEYLGSLANFAAIPKHERLKAPYRWALDKVQ